MKSGGAENVLVRLVEEFNKLGIDQTVIILSGSKSDFHYNKVLNFCNVLSSKNNNKKIDELLREKEIKIIAWMYKSIFYIQLKLFLIGINKKVYWNIRHSNFGFFQFYQKISLYFFGLLSKILGRGPIKETKLMPDSSRIGSIGGLVTCAKFWKK